MAGTDLKGRVALVTGGSRGIGRATVECLAELGADVAINYVRNKDAADSVVQMANAAGVRSFAVKADVRELADAEALVQAVVHELGRLDILICNAGIWEGADVDELTEELWNRTIEINLKGTWTVCRAAVPHMKEQNWGRIVIVSSTAGQRGEAGVSNYAASKGGQIAFTKSLAAELGSYGINVNAVAPGWVDTDMCSDVFEDLDRRHAIEKGIPVGRVATAKDIGWPIAFLCTVWARHITGEVLNVNGGSVLCG